jgi:hypothetical protein
MIPQVIFPNLESELIRCLKILLQRIDSPISSGVFVSVRKAGGDITPQPAKQITIRSDGGFIENRVIKNENFGINIWADTFQEASQLATYIEALLPLIPSVSNSVKSVSISLSATRINEPGQAEQRYITGTALIKGSNLTLKP